MSVFRPLKIAPILQIHYWLGQKFFLFFKKSDFIKPKISGFYRNIHTESMNGAVILIKFFWVVSKMQLSNSPS